jgi:hypothetical protein
VLLNDFNSASGNSRSLVRVKEEGSQSFNKNRNYFFIYIGAIVYFFLAQVILCILKNSGANLVLAEMDCGERKNACFVQTDISLYNHLPEDILMQTIHRLKHRSSAYNYRV